MAMDHAEAHERIADLALDRDALARLASADDGPSTDAAGAAAGTAPADVAFVAHVRGCQACRADLLAVRGVDQALRDALGELRDAASIEPMHPPESIRDAVLEAAHREPRSVHGPQTQAAPMGRPAGRWPFALPRLTSGQWAVALAAVLVVAVLGGVAGRALRQTGGSDASLTAAVATLDRVLVAPDHRFAALSTPTGAASGSVAWSPQDFVVLTSALSAPPAGSVYRCWLQWAGRWAVVGSMDFAGSTAYWSGPTGTWASLLGDPGTRFVVTAEPAGATGGSPTGTVVLQAVLGT
jgi:hypothetical protein